jgi:hypothetical protein
MYNIKHTKYFLCCMISSDTFHSGFYFCLHFCLMTLSIMVDSCCQHVGETPFEGRMWKRVGKPPTRPHSAQDNHNVRNCVVFVFVLPLPPFLLAFPIIIIITACDSCYYCHCHYHRHYPALSITRVYQLCPRRCCCS